MSAVNPNYNLDSYLAGILDGEGCVACHVGNSKQPSWMSVRVEVQMVHRAPLELLCDRLGGFIIKHEKRRKEHRALYRWRVAGKNARAALELISRMCVVKHKQASLALEALDLLCESRKVRISEHNFKRRLELAQLIKDDKWAVPIEKDKAA